MQGTAGAFWVAIGLAAIIAAGAAWSRWLDQRLSVHRAAAQAELAAQETRRAEILREWLPAQAEGGHHREHDQAAHAQQQRHHRRAARP